MKNYNRNIDKSGLVRDSYDLIKRRKDACNFVPLGEYTLVYRNYATLYFCLLIDGNESNLGILDLIQVMVESLDRAFESVCELDLVFHFDQVHFIIDEMIHGGLVIETNVTQIVNNGESSPLYNFPTHILTVNEQALKRRKSQEAPLIPNASWFSKLRA